MENLGARYLVNMYFDCKEKNIYPFPGGPGQQTLFTIELFNLLDGIVADTRRRHEEKAAAESKSRT
jgi:hypothetical protein